MAASFNTPDFIEAMRDAESRDEQFHAKDAVAKYLKPFLYGVDKPEKDELIFLLTNTDFPSVMVTAIRKWDLDYSQNCLYIISELGSNGYSLTKFVDEGIAEIIMDRLLLPNCSSAVIRGLWVIMKNSDYTAHRIFDIPDVMNTLKTVRSQTMPCFATKITYINRICDELSKISRRSIKVARN